jgi:hypothetical protein
MLLEYKTTIDTDSAIERAAFELAEAGHAGQSRGKEDARIGYITHPVMLYRLLKEMGERDEIMLSAALLHDVKEDCPKYEIFPDLLLVDISKKLQAEGFKDAQPIARHINAMVTQLTNPEKQEMAGGKRLWQVDHAARLTLREAKIKLLDQTASVLDYIMSPNATNVPDGKVAVWNFKALRLVKALAEEHAELAPCRDLHKVLFSYAMNIIKAHTPDAQAQLRAAFNWETAMEASKNLRKSEEVEVKKTVARRNSDAIEKGIISVELSAEGAVVGYHCLSANEKPNDDRTSTFNDLINNIESIHTACRATEGAPEIVENRLVRHVKVKPPMDIQRFFAIANECGALDRGYQLDIQRSVTALLQPQQQQMT